MLSYGENVSCRHKFSIHEWFRKDSENSDYMEKKVCEAPRDHSEVLCQFVYRRLQAGSDYCRVKSNRCDFISDNASTYQNYTITNSLSNLLREFFSLFVFAIWHSFQTLLHPLFQIKCNKNLDCTAKFN